MADPIEQSISEPEFLPADDAVTTGDDGLADIAGLLDYDPEDDPEVTPMQPAPIGRTWDFNFGTGTFNRLGTSPAQAHELRSLQMWAMMAINVERGAHPIFDDDFGVEDLNGMIGHAWDPALATDYQKGVREALLYHDRIAAVGEFTFDYDPANDYVEVTIPLRTDNGDDLVLEPRLQVADANAAF